MAKIHSFFVILDIKQGLKLPVFLILNRIATDTPQI
jgi:hypothetical protein